MPYQNPQPAEIRPDLVVAPAIPEDDRIWVPQAESVWFRPLCLNVSAGYWMNLLKCARPASSAATAIRPGPRLRAQGQLALPGTDWVASEGAYAFEPPGETHTLVVDEGVEEMITYFQVNGCMYYVDPWGRHTGTRTSSPRSTCAGALRGGGAGGRLRRSVHPLTRPAFSALKHRSTEQCRPCHPRAPLRGPEMAGGARPSLR